MKTKLISFIIFVFSCFNLFAQISQSQEQSNDEYLSFLKQQKTTAKEYIINLFKTKDIVIFSEGNHAEMEQYNLLLDVIKDPYFIKNVGAVYLEVCNINHSSTINRFLMHEGYDSIQAYEKIIELYQLGSYDHLWNCHNYPWLIYNLYNLNQTLKKDTKVQLYGCDIDFDWNNCKTDEDYTAIEPLLSMRDSIMADNFVKQYTHIQKNKNGKKKALVIMNSRHGFLKDIHYSETSVRNNTGRYLYEKYKDGVASVFMMSPGHPNSMDEYTVIKDGKWDAYFELSCKTDVGFNLRNTPFGQSKFDYRPNMEEYRYEDIYTGLIFYKPIHFHLLKRGWANAITDDFKPELIRRMKIMGFDDDEIDHEVKIENTERSEQYPDIDNMRKKIDDWKDRLLYKELPEKNIIQKTDNTGIFEAR